MKSIFVIALSSALFVLPAACQVPTQRESEPFVLEAGTHDIPALVDRVAAYLGYDILYDESELRVSVPGGAAARIRLTRRTEVDRRGCWAVASSLLQAQGYAILPLDAERGFYQLISVNGPRGREVTSSALFVEEAKVADYAGDSATPVLTTVNLRHINANIATNALRPFFAQAGSAGGGGSLTFGTAGNNTAMLVQGYGSQVHRAVQLLRQVDQPMAEAEFVTKVRRLEHAAPEDVAPILGEILDGRARMRGQALAENGMAGAALGASGGFGKVIVVPSLGALALSGTPTDVAEAMELIAQLDVPATTPRRPSEDQAKQIKQLEERIKVLEQAARAPK